MLCCEWTVRETVHEVSNKMDSTARCSSNFMAVLYTTDAYMTFIAASIILLDDKKQICDSELPTMLC
jgi:hypothetical protein